MVDEESELRRVARAARALLRRLVPDEAQAQRVDDELAAALQLPDGREAKVALRRVLLAAHAPLRPWALEQLPPSTSWPRSYRSSASRYISLLVAQQVPVNAHLSAVVKISLAPEWESEPLSPFEVPPQGITLTLVATAIGLVPETDTEYAVHVPRVGDSDPVRFGYQAPFDGKHTLCIYAFLGGRHLGHVSVQVMVGGTETIEHSVVRMNLGDLRSDPGEVTLVVARRHDGRNDFSFRGAGTPVLASAARAANEPTAVVERIVAELNALARETSDYLGVDNQMAHLKELGVELWADAVPDEIRAQFWKTREDISSFTVLSDLDSVPWELLYPLDYGQQDKGFLVEQFPVLRAAPEQRPARPVRLTSAVYVVSNDASDKALEELGRVRATLGSDVVDRGEVTAWADLREFLKVPASLLHFVGHNEFTGEDGSRIELEGGSFRPSELASVVQQRSLEGVAPVIFLNACRTAGEVPGLTRMVGWASQFMAAGASVFIGSLWEVRDDSAADFAVAFYESFVNQRLPLGAAVSKARQALKTDNADPTWLAYTVFGDPGCTLDLHS